MPGESAEEMLRYDQYGGGEDSDVDQKKKVRSFVSTFRALRKLTDCNFCAVLMIVL